MRFASTACIGAQKKRIDINQDLTWKNNYTNMYPAAAARIIEQEIMLPLPRMKEGLYNLELHPLDPGIVLHKIMDHIEKLGDGVC